MDKDGFKAAERHVKLFTREVNGAPAGHVTCSVSNYKEMVKVHSYIIYFTRFLINQFVKNEVSCALRFVILCGVAYTINILAQKQINQHTTHHGICVRNRFYIYI